MPTFLKSCLHALCQQILSEKLHALESQLLDLRQAASEETKSTAGDKYETSRAMLHIEQDNVRTQIAELMKQKAALNHLNPNTSPAVASPGSLLLTDKGYFYLSIPLGKIHHNDLQVIALSPHSPLGAKFLGRQAGDSISLNTATYNIIELF